MPACQTCGVTMAVSERTTGHQRGALPAATGNWHNACELVEFHEALAPAAGLQICLTIEKNKLINRFLNAASQPTVAPGGTIAVGTNMGIGAYKYQYTNVSANGESRPSPASAAITTTSGNQAVSVTGIAAGPTNTTSRKLYRTQVGGSVFNLVTTIAGNVTTTFSDTVADATIVNAAQPPLLNTFVATE